MKIVNIFIYYLNIFNVIFLSGGSVDLLREIESNLHALVLYFHKVGPGDQI